MLAEYLTSLHDLAFRGTVGKDHDICVPQIQRG